MRASCKFQISSVIRKDSVEKLDYYANKLGLSRGRLVNNLIESGLDDLRLFEVLGVLRAAHIGGLAKHRLVTTYLENDPLLEDYKDPPLPSAVPA